MRIARIFKERCVAPKECDYICIRFCPINKLGKKVIVIDEKTKKPIINEELCTGCGICVKKCPAEAIKIVNLPDEYGKILVHSYGKNAFKLFRLPIPRKDTIVSLIGENGLGKTTCIKILTGEIIPNFGEDETSPEKVIKRFRGTELQKYFSLLYQGKIKTSVKEQNIEKYRSEITVKEFLKESAIEYFNLTHLKDRKLCELSGGELQRVIIAKCFEKDADFYFLDEPTAFLDIKQRLEIIKKIIELSKDKRIVFVDHDLIFVDALSEITHIFYGQKGVFGVVSLPFSTKEAINQYLFGYIQRENVQIRDKPLLFEKRTEEVGKSNRILCKWEEIYVKLDGFELHTEEGEVYEEEIIGIVGENGIGKTTFAKVLAGVIKPKKGSVDRHVKIAYKPQYIASEYLKPVYVKDVIRYAGKDKLDNEFYRTHLLKPLEIHHLMRKKLTELSGGELQKVAIAVTLLTDADLYILDEPSAFLDIESRIRLARIIRDVIKAERKAAIVIDHDLLLIDYISDRIIVFDGIPGKRGIAKKPTDPKEALNYFLMKLDITIRREEVTKRPRLNKPGSRKDLEQKRKKMYIE